MSALLAYDEACRLLAEAVAVDEVLDIRSKSDAMRHYARQCKNLDAEINAGQIRLRAERRLGEMLRDAKDTGQIKEGKPHKSNCSEPEQLNRVTLEEAGIDRKLSMRAQKIADIGPVRFEALMGMIRDKAQAGGRVIVDVLKIDAENEQRDNRRNLARELSEASVAFSGAGQKVACIYADPAWHRKQGVTNRSYENHYPTMSWEDICAMPVADRLLPDAWLFLWIPRAHMFALHPVPMDFKTDDGEVITRAVKMPLAWAVARAWGFDAYSTAFIWTKTDEEHPGDQGGGVLVYQVQFAGDNGRLDVAWWLEDMLEAAA